MGLAAASLRTMARFALRDAALRLIAIGDRFGVHNNIAVNALHDDFTVSDANGGFWPQCERLKAALIAATADRRAAVLVDGRGGGRQPFPLSRHGGAGPMAGRELANGEFAVSPSPASTFYHWWGPLQLSSRAA